VQQLVTIVWGGSLPGSRQRNEGVALARALEEHPSVFPPIYVSMVEAAEAAGTLENVLSQLADLFERRAKLMNKVRRPGVSFVHGRRRNGRGPFHPQLRAAERHEALPGR
jgi:hypothetical protein